MNLTWGVFDRLVYKLLISAVVPRPIAFVASLSESGIPNLAPFRRVHASMLFYYHIINPVITTQLLLLSKLLYTQSVITGSS